MVKRGRHSLFRPLIAVAICSVILFPLIHPVLPLSAQGPLGERLTGFDINTLPGTGNKSARGVCSDGETLWVVEERALKLFAYSLMGDVPTRDEDGDIQLDFYQNYGPGGCAADETTIWVADDEFDKLIAYDIASKARDGDNDIDTLAAAGNNRVDDVALHGSTVWVADSLDKALYAYELRGGARVADKDIALHTTEMSPKGLWTDGNTMWVADSLSGHFFAYELAAGTRDTTKEFVASDATNVQGIWSNGRVLWAANRNDGSDQGNKVLAYRMPVSASSDATLSALSLSGVTLTPTFSSGTTAYTASVANTVTETTVTATAAVGAGFEVKLNDVVEQDGIVPLEVGDGNVIAVVVTAQDGETTTTYTVTVTRAGSGDASLSALSLSGVTLSPAFASGKTVYAASVANTVTETTVTATAAVGAGFEVKLNGVVDQDGIVPLEVGDGNVIAVVVTAQDGETTTYTVTVTRAGSGDASLSALSLSGVTLSPAFASGKTVYAASVGHAVTETTVTATAVAGAAYVVKLNDVVDQDGIVGLAVGAGNVIAVEVKAEDGETTQRYTVTVTRAGSGDATLSALLLSGVTLTPAFASGTTAYTASVGHAVTETTVTATASDANASVEVKVDGVVDQDGVVLLAVGDGNVITAVVTAQDGETTQTYTVTLTRVGSGDASLSSLSLSGVTLTPAFASGTTAYTASVGHAVAETTVTAAAAAGATYEMKLNGVVDQDGVVPLAVGDGNVIAVVVTAQDGETTQSYSVTVTRAGSGDAGLSALSLSGVALSPAFAPGTTTYTASVGYAVAETTVTATLADAGAAYEVKLNGVSDQDGIVPLAVGVGNVIAVVVTAQDGETTQMYTVTVTRVGSADASLSALSLSGVTLMPDFASGTTTYTASVGHAVAETTVTATASDANASVEVTPEDADDGTSGDRVALAVGETTISVEVTAEDGEETQTYTVTVMRTGSGDASLSSLSLSGVTLTPAFASGTTVYRRRWGMRWWRRR